MTSVWLCVRAPLTCSYQISYAIPLFLRVTWGRKLFFITDFSLGGFSQFAHGVGALWLVFNSILLFWPMTHPITNANMNWTTVVVVGVFVIGALHWGFVARHTFRGPQRKEGEQAKVSVQAGVRAASPADDVEDGNLKKGEQTRSPDPLM